MAAIAGVLQLHASTKAKLLVVPRSHKDKQPNVDEADGKNSSAQNTLYMCPVKLFQAQM